MRSSVMVGLRIAVGTWPEVLRADAQLCNGWFAYCCVAWLAQRGGL